ncbi:putative receptor-like protein kinase [Hibiscus syriacus]|uniref:Receptor-like protein kinase n=1 Tax=Hibiscus syriacus TaxID=106335 RepID=A0A6A3CW23_HIBSY|nr:putative receptor-like protein kinase [Hibiscus syriacus]
MAQRDMAVAQYFHKVKSICREISELDPTAAIGEARIKRIIDHGLRPEYRGFVAAVQGWPTQPSLVEFENLLAGQEAMAKQMGGVSLKGEEEVLYTRKSRGTFQRYTGNESKKDGDKVKNYQGKGGPHSGGASKNRGNSRKFDGKCYNCGKMGHMAKDCWTKKKPVESNTATSCSKENSEDGWDAEALFATEEEELALTKLQNLSEYNGGRVVVTADNSGHYVLFGPQDVKVYRDVKITETPTMEGRRLESIYVMSAESAYVDRTRKNETSDLWHMRLGHVSYSKISVMVKKSMLKGLPQLDVRTDTVCAGCQYGNVEYVISTLVPHATTEWCSGKKNRYLAEICRSMLHAKNVSGRFWAEAMRTAAFVINRLPQPRLGFVSPFEKLWNIKPTVSYFRVFGCPEKGWKCCDPISGRCYTSRNVVFDEALLGGPQRRRCCQIRENLETNYNKRWGSMMFNFKQVQMNQKIQMAMMSNKDPMAKLTTVRVLLALAANKDWNLWQMDVKNAFLHGELDREIYMTQPMGFQSQDHPEYVCKLRKALYGLKQAPRAWYGKIAEFLMKSGYSVTPADSSLFVKANEGKLAIVLVYVDDLIITGDDEAEILQTKENLSVRFQMKELGQLKHFLGLESTSTPMEPNIKMCAHEGKDLEDATMYRQLVEGEDCKLVGYCDADYAGDHDTRRSTTGFFTDIPPLLSVPLVILDAVEDFYKCARLGDRVFLADNLASKLLSAPENRGVNEPSRVRVLLSSTRLENSEMELDSTRKLASLKFLSSTRTRNPELKLLTICLVSFTALPENVLGNTSKSVTSSDHSPLYQTARIFTGVSKYKLSISRSGRHLIRLYFYPFVHASYNMSMAKFNVSTENHVLLSSFSVQSILVKEFSVIVITNSLAITFSPSHNSFAFINALEVVSVLDQLIPDTAGSVQSSTGFQCLTLQALETVARVNMGDLPSPTRTILFGEHGSVKYVDGGSTEDIAPNSVYGTCTRMISVNDSSSNFNVTSEFDVDPGFQYLVRFHFCDIVSDALDQLYFNAFIDSSMVVRDLDLSTYLVNVFVATFYMDYVTESATSNKLRVSIGPSNLHGTYLDAILNGLEIMKMNNSDGSLSGLGIVNSSVSSSKKKDGAIVGTTVGVASGVLLAGVLFMLCRKRRRLALQRLSKTWVPFSINGGTSHTMGSKYSKGTTVSLNSNMSCHVPFLAVQGATNNFDESWVIGIGGFGKVYKGELNDGTKVAVKRGNPQSQQGLAEFQTEIEMLSQFCHQHLVSLIGYCDEKNEMILIYEYMENGTLNSHLYGSGHPSLSWKQRLEICIGAARGLHYLHTGYAKAVIHRELKSKSDVYLFGVVLFEVLCARPVIDPTLPREMVNLAEWAMKWQMKGQLKQIMDPNLKGNIRPDSLRKFGETAEKCLADFGVDRPSMGDVLCRAGPIHVPPGP